MSVYASACCHVSNPSRPSLSIALRVELVYTESDTINSIHKLVVQEEEVRGNTSAIYKKCVVRKTIVAVTHSAKTDYRRKYMKRWKKCFEQLLTKFELIGTPHSVKNKH